MTLQVAVAATTCRENAVKLAVALPSDTWITILAVVAISVAVGAPLNLPVAVSKLAHAGLLLMLKVSVSLSTSLTVGVKLYAVPTVAFALGVPLITGG